MNILVVEDEKNLADAIVKIVCDEGYNCEAVYDGNAGLASCKSGLYDAVIMDVMLPGMDGFEIVHELRRSGNSIPVLMLTARIATSDKVTGLDTGADDYMTKPFEAPELLARLSCKGHTVHLSGKEFEVLKMLMSSNARVVSKQDLLTRVWGTDGEASENSVEAYISFLRKKLTHVHSMVQITTLRMLGYRLEVFEVGDGASA